MNTRRFPLPMAAAAVLLAGCCTFGGQPKCNLSDAELNKIDIAKRACNYVNVNAQQLTLRATPIVDGKELPALMTQLGKNSKADFAIFETLWNQDVCIIQDLAPKMPYARVNEWNKEVAQAFIAIPPHPNGTYQEQIAQIEVLRDKHVKRLQAKDASTTEQFKFDMFAVAIPEDNFLKITTLHSEITFPDNSIVKGRNIAKSALSGDLAPGEFSEEIRPALQAIRTNLGAYVRGKANEQEILTATVESIYYAAENKVRNSQATKTETPASTQDVKIDAAVAAPEQKKEPNQKEHAEKPPSAANEKTVEGK